MKNKKLAIVAVGGNSLVKDEKRKSSRHQYMIVKETAHHIADMIEAYLHRFKSGRSWLRPSTKFTK